MQKYSKSKLCQFITIDKHAKYNTHVYTFKSNFKSSNSTSTRSNLNVFIKTCKK